MYVRAVVGIMMRMTKRVRKDGLVVMRGDVGDGTIIGVQVCLMCLTHSWNGYVLHARMTDSTSCSIL